MAALCKITCPGSYQAVPDPASDLWSVFVALKQFFLHSFHFLR